MNWLHTLLGIFDPTALELELVNGNAVLSADDAGTNIGTKTNIRKPVKVFGPLSVNVSNPDPTVNFTVGGDVSIGDKRFTNGRTAPVTGSYVIGDICWNTNPASGHHIGWVCVSEGNPGIWTPFGLIN